PRRRRTAPRARRLRAGLARCRARVSRRSSCPEPPGLFAVLGGDLLLARSDEAPAAHDVRAADDQAIDAVRAREDEVGDGVLGAAELEPVRSPDREVGAPARR